MEEMDKLLENLQKVNVEFNNQLSKYEALIHQTKRTNEKLEKYTDSNRDKVDRLCIRVEAKLGEISQQVEEITKECTAVLNQYSTEIASFNEKERTAFSKVILGDLENYKKEFLQDVLGDYQKILQVFMDKIQEEADYVVTGQQDMAALVKTTEETNADLVTQIHGLRVIVNGCLDAINHTIAGINDSYMTIFAEFSKQVNSVNKEDREQFIGELSKTLEEYKADYGIYGTMLQESRNINQELKELTLQNTESVQAMEQQISRRLSQTESIMDHISKAYEQGFNSFAKDVSVLNSRERENLVVTLRSMLEEYRFSFGREIESKGKELNTLFQNTLVGVCNNFAQRNKELQQLLDNTKNSNVEMHDSLQRTLMEIEGLTMSLMRREEYIQDALEFLKEDYQGAIKGYVQEIEKSNVKAREQLEQNAIQNMSSMTERFLHQLELFKSERSTYMQQMEELLEKEHKDRESMLNRQAEVINLLKLEQDSLKRQLTNKQEELNRYQMVTSTFSLVLMVICILLVIPWKNVNFLTYVLLPAIILLGVAVIIFRRRITAWLKKIREQWKKHEKA